MRTNGFSRRTTTEDEAEEEERMKKKRRKTMSKRMKRERKTRKVDEHHDYRPSRLVPPSDASASISLRIPVIQLLFVPVFITLKNFKHPPSHMFPATQFIIAL